jgi:hypothetical protein
MNRRESLAGIAGTFATAFYPIAASAAPAGMPVDYATLDRRPDAPRVEGLAASIVGLARGGNNSGRDYGASMRVLSKALAVLNEEERDGIELCLDDERSNCVSGRINRVVLLVRGSGLNYPSSVRALTHAMGVLSEEHRTA